MNRTLVCTTLTNKFNEWLNTIADPFIRQKITNNAFIAGGCIASLLLNEKPKDYDVFFLDQSILTQVVNYYSNGDENLYVDYQNDNAILLKNGIHIVKKLVGNPAEVCEKFDFQHCKCSYCPSTNALTIPSVALEPMLTKELIYTGSDYPFSSLVRTKKFIKRGWNISAFGYIGIARQIQKINLDDYCESISSTVFDDEIIPF